MNPVDDSCWVWQMCLEIITSSGMVTEIQQKLDLILLVLSNLESKIEDIELSLHLQKNNDPMAKRIDTWVKTTLKS